MERVRTDTTSDYNYLITKRGSLKFDFDSTVNYYLRYDLIDANSDSANTSDRVWAMKNVKPLKEEVYTSSILNFISRLSFRLFSVNRAGQNLKFLSGNWFSKASSLLNDEEFGLELNYPNKYIKETITKACAGSSNEYDKAKKIYNYVKDNYTCNDEYGIYLSQPLKDIFNAKKGSISDINLLLTAALISQGIKATPVILSTRQHGIAPQTYPEMDMFNYVITRLTINDSEILLDASDKNLSFNHLPLKCYNGYGRIINFLCPPILLSADSLKDFSFTSASLSAVNKGIHGNLTSVLGYYNSLALKKDLQKLSTAEYFLNIKKQYPYEVNITNTSLDSLSNANNQIITKYDFSFPVNDDIIYFNPLLTEAIKENPFQAAQRSYPVEMPYCINQTYVLNMETPEGYTIDELPKSARLNLNGSDGMFEYIIGKTENGLQLRCHLVLNKANFQPEDYQTLRDFYSFIVQKESEQIVFKKIK